MKFGAWHPLDQATAAAPDAPGVLQARADELLAYPRGRSAMVLYAHSGGERLRPHVAGRGAEDLGRAGTHGARWVRFGEAADPAAACARLLASFVERFGAPPLGNAQEAHG